MKSFKIWLEALQVKDHTVSPVHSDQIKTIDKCVKSMGLIISEINSKHDLLHWKALENAYDQFNSVWHRTKNYQETREDEIMPDQGLASKMPSSEELALKRYSQPPPSKLPSSSLPGVNDYTNTM